jgi:hypothetical protein
LTNFSPGLEQPWVNDHKKNGNAVGVGEVDRG